MLYNNNNNEFSGAGNSFGYMAPFMIIDEGDNQNIKSSHDDYRVFVNGDYIGKKVLISENEKPEDLDKYLVSQGFTNFSTEVNGGNLIIHCDNNIDEIENILGSYLSIR